jgi:hypothetical protein
MTQRFDIHRIIAFLNNSSIVSKVELLQSDEIESRSFHKLKCTLVPSKYLLDIKFIKTETELLYAYQLYEKEGIARWDNEPHYPKLKNYPHHFHYRDKVKTATLTGMPLPDIAGVLSVIPNIIASHQEEG